MKTILECGAGTRINTYMQLWMARYTKKIRDAMK